MQLSKLTGVGRVGSKLAVGGDKRGRGNRPIRVVGLLKGVLQQGDYVQTSEFGTETCESRMQIGFNNDIEYRGKTFHIQTEDRGMDAAQVETQIFQGGAILDTAIIPYEKHVKDLEGDALISKIRQIMQVAHKNFYKKLHAGDYDELVGLEPLESAAPPDLPKPDEFEPGRDRVPGSAVELEDNPDAFAIEDEMGEAVDLNEIHRKLQEDAKKAEAAEVLDDDGFEASSVAESDAPTMMVTAAELSEQMNLDQRDSGPDGGALEWPPTGVQAWKGCENPRDDLSIVGLVEKFLAS